MFPKLHNMLLYFLGHLKPSHELFVSSYNAGLHHFA